MLKVGVMAKPALPFEDIQSVTNSIDCVAAGKDPYTVRCDPWGRPLNYPSVWLDLRFLGVTSKTTTLLGTVFACMTAATLLLLLRATRLLTAAIVFLAVTSRPVLLLIERGNTDQVIFCFLVCGLLWTGYLGRRQAMTATRCLLIVLTALKVYPVAAVVTVARNRKSLLPALGTALAALAVLVLVSGRHLLDAVTGTPQMYMASFGSYPFFFVAGRAALHAGDQALATHHGMASLLALMMFGMAVFAGVFHRERLAGLVPRIHLDGARGQLAAGCMAILCFAFMGGASFNYRLIFLLGVLSYVVDDLNGGSPARYSLVAALTMLAFLCLPGRLLLVHEALDGIVFVCLSAWLAATLSKEILGPGGPPVQCP